MLRFAGVLIILCFSGQSLGGLLAGGGGGGGLMDLAYEGSCSTPPGKLASNLDLGWITTLPKLYVTYGSLDYFFQNAEACLGRKPLTLAVLTNMNLQIVWDLNTTMTCFGRSITQQCSLNPNNGNPFASCNVVASDPGTNPKVFQNYSKRVVLTDNQTFALFVRCTDGRESYYIASPTPQISQFAILQSVAKIIELGYDIAKLVKIPLGPQVCAL